MKKPPHTERRGGQWWFRRRVPDQLVPIIGRAEFRESLRTSDMEVARTRAAFRDAEVAIEFEKAKAALRQQQVAPLQLDELTPEEQQYVRDRVRAHVLEEDDAVRMARPDDETREVYEGLLADQYEDASRGLRTGGVVIGRYERERMAKLLAAIDLPVDPKAAAWEATAFKATEGLYQALRDIGQRTQGDFVSTPSRPTVPVRLASVAQEVDKATAAAVTLGEVIDHYLKGLPDNDFQRKVKRCLQLFGEMIGRSLPITDLRQKAVTEFMRDICRLPALWARRFDSGESIASMLATAAAKVMSPTTYEANYRGPMGTFLEVSASIFGDDGFRAMSVKTVKYTGNRVAEEDQQRPLEDQELKVLFEGDAFQRITEDPDQEPLYWFLVVLLFTGARPRELCQLNPQVDFGEMEGHWYIDLDAKTAAGAGVKKSIKTGETRRLPLHTELVRLGFPAYLQRIKDAGGDRLFPSWRVKGGNPFSAHYELVSGHLKAVGLYTRTAPPGELVTGAYVFRKTFITQCRNQGLVSKEITGHADGLTTPMQDRHYLKGPEPFQRKLGHLSRLLMPVRIPMRGAVA